MALVDPLMGACLPQRYYKCIVSSTSILAKVLVQKVHFYTLTRSGDFALFASAKSSLGERVSGAAHMRFADLSVASTRSPQDHFVDVIVRSAVRHVLRLGALDRECCGLVKEVGGRRL